MAYIRSPTDMHPKMIDGAAWFPAREVAELLKTPWRKLDRQTAPQEKKRVYRYVPGYRSCIELLISEGAARHLAALYWDQPTAVWRAYADQLQGRCGTLRCESIARLSPPRQRQRLAPPRQRRR